MVSKVARLKAVTSFFLRILTVCSSLHLILITCERLIAVKFTMSYPCIVTKRKFKVAVIFSWAFSLTSQGTGYFSNNIILNNFFNYGLPYPFRHRNLCCTVPWIAPPRTQDKTQKMPPKEVERLVKENKVLNTTAFVVSAVLLSFLPMAFGLAISSIVVGVKRDLNLNTVLVVWVPLARPCTVLNLLLNLLIYCLRQKEMRKFVFRAPCKPVEPAMKWTEHWKSAWKLVPCKLV